MARTDTEIREAVRKAYAERALDGSSCCGDGCGPTGETIMGLEGAACGPDGCGVQPGILQLGSVALPAAFGTPSAVTEATLPAGAVSWGCGNPLAIDALQPGEVVVDLGSGAGYDCFLAALNVGPSGRIIGVDMTPEMIDRARKNLGEMGLENVEFRQGLIESLPVEDDTADVVISNCVINLAPDKQPVLNEAFRVLKSGGRFQVADMVLTRPVSEVERDDMATWTSCGSGSLLKADYEAMLRQAGFVDVKVDAPDSVTPWTSGLISARKP